MAASPPPRLLVLAADSPAALEAEARRLAATLGGGAGLDLAALARDLQEQVQPGTAHRLALVARDPRDAASILDKGDRRRLFRGRAAVGRRPVAFLFPGHGGDFLAMGRGLYRDVPAFRRPLDECAEVLRRDLGLELPLTRPDGDGELDGEPAGERELWRLAPLSLFVVELALARLWMEWGVSPCGMIGHSLGEYVAATVAGVLEPADALAVVAARVALLEAMPEGAMTSVSLPEDELMPWLEAAGVSLAAVNSPRQCVASGPPEAVAELEARLEARGVDCLRLAAPRAGHSSMVEAAMGALETELGRRRLAPPRIPYVSNVTGTWIRPEEAQDPAYWGRHFRHTVRFGAGVGVLLAEPETLLLEVGPGRTLAALVKRCDGGRRRAVLASMRHQRGSDGSEAEFLLGTAAALWVEGVELDGRALAFEAPVPPAPERIRALPRTARRLAKDGPGPRAGGPTVDGKRAGEDPGRDPGARRGGHP